MKSKNRNVRADLECATLENRLTAHTPTMSLPRIALVLLTLVCAHAQQPEEIRRGLVAITLEDGADKPGVQMSVVVGSPVRITAPVYNTGRPFAWWKKGSVIPGASSNVLTLPPVVWTDAGPYVYREVTADPIQAGSQVVELGVGPVSRLLNTSILTSVRGEPGGGFVFGFIVAGPETKRLIIRAVGPSLSRFGINDGLQSPIVEIFDSDGKPYTNSYIYFGSFTTAYEADLARSLARCGAFPLAEGAADVVQMRPIRAGSYTIQVRSRNGASGRVLFELYEVP
jgi:hypothetical protein